MKKILTTLFAAAFCAAAVAQPQPPEPFPIDHNFSPTLEFLQKAWEGQYWGVVPPERTRYYITRSLTLNADMTFTNLVTISTSETAVAAIALYEEGTYIFTPPSTLSFDIRRDSTLDMMAWMADETITYTVNTYEEGDEPNNTEEANFTFSNGGDDESRLWVAFDQKFMSDQNPAMKAVYTMQGKHHEETAIGTISAEMTNDDMTYDLLGRRSQKSGIVITQGKKFFRPRH